MGSASGDEPPMHSVGGLEERILVSVRLRPLNTKEISKHDVSDWERTNDNTLIYRNSTTERSMYPNAYTFDRVFGKDSPTKKVYEEGAKEVALSVVSGINSSIFAYGQTSSGKTYTMSGVTEFAVQDIYRYVQKHHERTFVLKFSAMEIYNEAVRDLLSPDQTPLRLLDDPERGTVVDKLTEETLRDYDHLKELLSVCEAQRQIGETTLNEVSSRSHQILRLTIESSAREFLGKDNSSTLAASVHFVDLAGSERASQTNSAGPRLKEGCHINRSLLTLGTVVRKLSKGRNGHVPYRDSKLTRILQCSLGGNGRTAIICTISPARTHVEQTRNTLSFASCAKEVATNAQVNVVMSDKALVKHLQRQLTRLESELSGIGSKYSTPDSAALLREKDRQIEEMEKEIKELTLQRDIAQARLDKLIQAGHVPASELLAEFGQYPRLRAPITFVDESMSPALSDYSRVKRSNRSQYSSGCSESSFGECAKVNLEEHFLFDGPSPRLYIISPERGSPNPYKNWEGITQEDGDGDDFEELCKDVRCIELEQSTTNSIAASSSLTCAEGEVTFTETDTTTDQAIVSAAKNGHAESTHGGVEKKFQDVPESSDCEDSSKISNHSRSSSRSETLMTESRSPLHSKEEENENASPSRSEKEFSGTPRDIREKYSNPSSSCISREYSLTSERSDVTDELKAHNIEEKKQKTNGDGKIVKDVGLDPMYESPSKWPLEFKRQQKEIIELWHVCHISLVHRTYFFLLFKGDPSDSIYVEVERRRLSFLKDLYSRENRDKIYIEGSRDLTLASSKRGLRRERETLSKQIHKKIPKEERENLFQKWGIGLNSKERKLQLARRLWTDTEDMNHITESANLVAKLVGLEEPKQGLKEMFILSFTPQKSHSRSRSYNWRSN